MIRVTDPREGIADHFGSWLKTTLTGCHFAASLTKARRWTPLVWMNAHGAALVNALDLLIEEASTGGHFTVLILPKVRTEGQLVEALDTLIRHSTRWTAFDCTEEGAVGDLIAMDLRWRNSESECCSAMGLGPFATMPVTRRAPYPALAIWGGSRLNSYRKKPHEFVGVGDMNPEMDEKPYAAANSATLDRVKALRALHDEARPKTGVTFYLSRAATASLTLAKRPTSESP